VGLKSPIIFLGAFRGAEAPLFDVSPAGRSRMRLIFRFLRRLKPTLCKGADGIAEAMP
jgi:hypothetical protein